MSRHINNLDMATFDQLPPMLREAMTGAPYPVKAGEMQALLDRLAWNGVSRSQGAALVVQLMPEAEQENLLRFAASYERRYRTPHPHVAAGVSLLRESARRPTRPRRAG